MSHFAQMQINMVNKSIKYKYEDDSQHNPGECVTEVVANIPSHGKPDLRFSEF